MEKDSVIQMWENYRKINPEAPKDYDVWAFGNSKEVADKLLGLVLEEKKTATSSNYNLYELGKEKVPFVGLYNIILDGNGTAAAILVTTSIEIIPFEEVSKEHAYLEGEGDRSLKYWRDVHEEFFKEELKGTNQEFNYQIPIVCERFKLVYKK